MIAVAGTGVLTYEQQKDATTGQRRLQADHHLTI